MASINNLKGWPTSSKIDSGSYGEVHIARDEKSQSLYAVKIQEAVNRDRALREAKVLKMFKECFTRHAVPYRADFDRDGRHYLVMEWIDYPSLSRVWKDAPYDLGTVIRITKQFLEFLKDCHQLGWIHADLTSSNAIFNNGLLTVLDPGLAQETKGPLSPDVQTVNYRAPEIVFGKTDYDQSIDLWSLGCIIFQLCTDKLLFPMPEQDILDQEFCLVQGIGDRIGFDPEVIEKMARFEEFFKKSDQEETYHYQDFIPGIKLAPYFEEVREIGKKRGYSEETLERLILLMDKMFQFKNRITAAEALQDPLFQEFDFHFRILQKDLKCSKLFLQIQNDQGEQIFVDLSQSANQLSCLHLAPSASKEYRVAFFSKEKKKIGEEKKLKMENEAAIVIENGEITLL